MDNTTRTNIITAAVMATGPAGDDPAAWQAKVQENAVSIAVMASETSNIAKALTSIENSKVFPGTVVSVRRERSSTRGIVTIYTGTDRVTEGVPAGCEQVRTDRTDGAIGLAMAKKAKAAIGARILMWVEVEEYNGGQGKVRVLKHFEILTAEDKAPEVQALLTAA